MGLAGENAKDHWEHDPTAATWTRVVVEPRKDFYNPSEGEEQGRNCPKLEELRDTRVTIPKFGTSVKDNWRKTDSSEEPLQI